MTNVQTTRRSSCRNTVLALSTSLVLAVAAGSSATAEGPFILSRTPVSGAASEVIDVNRRSFGMNFRGGHSAGDTVGRTDSLSHVSLFPYVNAGDALLFGDARLGRANEGGLTWSFGAGLRRYIEEWDVVTGANFYHSRDDITGTLLKTWGVGADVLTDAWEARVNYYRPNGVSSQLVSQSIDQNSAAFAGNNIVFNRIDTVAEALEGVDLETGCRLPTGCLENVTLKALGGAYHYKGQTIRGFTGWQARLQCDIAEHIELGLKLTDDEQFNTSVLFSAIVYFGGFKAQDYTRHCAIQRLAEPVRRNLNVAAVQTDVLFAGQVAIDPNDGLPLQVVHVDENDVIGPFVGTVEAPLGSLTTGLGFPGTDIVFVHAGGVYNAAPDNTIALTANQNVFGEGVISAVTGDRLVVNTVALQGLGELTLPSSPTFISSGFTLARPVLQGSPANSVTLANRTRFGGFVIDGAAGHGIFSNAAEDTVIRDVLVQNTGGSGILLENTTSSTTILDTIIDTATGPAFHVNGGNGSIGFQGNSVGLDPSRAHIANISQEAVLIENMLAGGVVNMFGATINDTGGTGVLIQNNAGSATIDNARIVDSTDSGIRILNSTGNYNFRSSIRANTLISNAAQQAVLIDGLGAGSLATFQTLQIDNRNNTGVDVNNNSGQIDFLNTVAIGTPAAGAGVGVSVIGSQAGSSVRFSDNLDITGSNDRGIDLTGNLAGSSFTVADRTTISGAAGESIAIVNDAGTTVFQGGTGITQRGDRGVSIQGSIGSISFRGATSITNELADLNPTPAFDIQNSEANVSVSSLRITDATTNSGPGGAGIHLVNNLAGANNTAIVGFGNVNVETIDGAGVFGLNNTRIRILSGSVMTTNDAALNIEESGWNIALNSVTSLASPTNGIRLVNAAPPLNNTFTVGQSTFVVAIGSSGTIQAATNAGALLMNAGQVGFSGMLFDANAFGVFLRNDGLADDDDQRLELLFSGVSQSGISGIDAQNLTTLFVSDSLFDDNGADGALGRETFDLSYNEAPNNTDTTLFSQFDNPYEVFIGRTVITDNTDDALVIRSLPGGLGAHIDVDLDSNSFNLDGDVDPDLLDLSEAAFEFDWNGPARVRVINNLLLMSGLDPVQSQTAFDITNRSTTDELLLSVVANDLTSTHATAVGLDLRTFGMSSSLIDTNLFVFSGLDSTGMRFNMAADALMTVSGNQLRFDDDGGAGIIYTLVNQPSTFLINNNQIGMSDNGGLIEEGIRFLASIGSPALQGNQNNQVFLLNPGAPGSFIEIPFSFAGTPAGSIIVNGVLVP